MDSYANRSKEAQEEINRLKDAFHKHKEKLFYGGKVVFRFDIGESKKRRVVCATPPDLNYQVLRLSDLEGIGFCYDDLPCFVEYRNRVRSVIDPIKEYYRSHHNFQLDRIKEIESNVLAPAYYIRRIVYDEYMSSPEWAAKRQECFQVHGTTCIDCKLVEATDIHHRHYETLGDESPMDDIIPLCSLCHAKRHSYNSLMDKPEV